MSIFLELLIITIIVSITTSIPGSFLVLQGRSLTTFALSHSILFGIVLIFLFTGSLDSPVLITGAAITGLFIVWLVEYLTRARFVQKDAALGLVYMFIFSLGIILASLHSTDFPLNPKSIVTGNFALIVFSRFIIYGNDLGPIQMWVSFVILLIVLTFTFLLYKELKLISFNPDFATSLGINTRIIQLSFMFVVSLVVVSVYQMTGVIMVVSMMVIPPASAYILTNSVGKMIAVSVTLSLLGSMLGFILAWWIGKVEIASTIGVFHGLIFLVILLLHGKTESNLLKEGIS